MASAVNQNVDRQLPRSMMRAAVLRGQEDLRIEDVPIPTAGPGELVLRVAPP